MIDRLFTAALAFVVLAGGTAAVGSALFAPEAAQSAAVAQTAVKRLPRVEVVVERAAPGATIAQGESETKLR